MFALHALDRPEPHDTGSKKPRDRFRIGAPLVLRERRSLHVDKRAPAVVRRRRLEPPVDRGQHPIRPALEPRLVLRRISGRTARHPATASTSHGNARLHI